jgi:predicted RNA-binding protein associated with RNAse of E/G family
MQKKDMGRSEWTQIRSKKQIINDFMYAENTGKISLFRIDEIDKPFIKKHASGSVTLADYGYYWLQLAMEQDFAWFTVMFDPEGKLLEIYIDVTDGNHTDCEIPWFEDLYIDFTADVHGFRELDQNELQQAYADHLITEDQYNSSLSHADMIRFQLQNHHDQLIAFFRQRFEEMRFLLEEL